MTDHPINIDSAGGEYMESVVVLGWAAKVGEPVKAGSLIVTVETAKAATEIEASHDGWLKSVAFTQGQEAPVGAILGVISDIRPATDDTATETPSAPSVAVVERTIQDVPGATPSANARIVASPLARRIAEQAGLDLGALTGTGPNGRIKQRDVMAALDARKRTAPAMAAVAAAAPVTGSRDRKIPLVLLHGFAADRASWRQVIPLLGSDREIVAIDLPGHGSNSGMPATGIAALADYVSDELERRNISRVHIVGHSLGGATALAVAECGRVAIQSMTLIAPAGLGPEINGDFIAGLLRSASAESLGQWLHLMVGDRESIPDGYAAAAHSQMERNGSRDALKALADRLFESGFQTFDLMPALERLHIPVRILWGRADRIIPPAHAARVPGEVAVHMLSGVGHVPQLEVPATTANLLLQTIRSAG